MRKKYDISIDSKNRSVFENFHIASILLVIYDIIMSAGAYLAALWIRFDCQYSQIPQDYFMAWLKFMPVYAVICVSIFWLFKLYQSVWKYASFSELARMAVASLILGIFYTVGITVIFKRMPVAYYVGGIVIQFMLSLALCISLYSLRAKQTVVETERRHGKPRHADRCRLSRAHDPARYSKRKRST